MYITHNTDQFVIDDFGGSCRMTAQLCACTSLCNEKTLTYVTPSGTYLMLFE